MELTVELSESEARFLEDYASKHDISVGELVARYVRRLQRLAPHPENLKFIGTVPTDIDARKEYVQHIENKHR